MYLRRDLCIEKGRRSVQRARADLVYILLRRILLIFVVFEDPMVFVVL